MFDETFFKTSLPEHISAKAAASADQPVVHIKLRSGQEYKIGRILEVSPQWVMLEIYPPDGKAPRPNNAQTPSAGVSAQNLDRLAIAYEYIVLVLITLEPRPRDLGFRAG
ncbi:MAG: hypothetical protein AB7N91_17170 [Candidatus Tectimicrobiota bacterium]